ncbi:hypothetical protein BABINDRAFT_160545 [Babjeviella inositovora NRRL Y-12698]|uniref:Uncharacterized protein n=1 Tax=Babjeviella inositovora NRRL Y-12698 TaxID=984486 RepID=A0A1E3QTY3_9ASCO|nr:uncharacterized protein BABINDRAFT_160545 [Babjeviella inositovora NRRL Y-12698]ODQ81145.1 hypothetical protein BABINDRAFT_160545 [Babjeviella inositovora NRRL Y-12698]
MVVLDNPRRYFHVLTWQAPSLAIKSRAAKFRVFVVPGETVLNAPPLEERIHATPL